MTGFQVTQSGPLDRQLRATDEMTGVREADRRGAVPVDLGATVAGVTLVAAARRTGAP